MIPAATLAQNLPLAAAIATVFLILTIFVVRYRWISKSAQHATTPEILEHLRDFPEPTALSKALSSALPGTVIFPHDVAAFQHSMNSYWAQQECEVIPACVFRPHNIKELCAGVVILKQEYDNRVKEVGKREVKGVFAVRSGGHSPLSGAASLHGGVVIDLGLFNQVRPSEDGNVIIGTGAKWMDVSKVLDKKGRAVIGGRNSVVGVGGLALGGGLSFFSPRLGFVCSNVVSYEIVLASGLVTTASETTNPDLWRALKGGSNNFGIVTHFTMRSFPSTSIWSGFIYVPSSQASKVIAAFHESVNRVDSDMPNTPFDENAAGPLVCFSHVHQLGIQIISVNLVYTKLPYNDQRWPIYWQTSPFASLWRFWSTCKVCSLTSATDEMNALNAPGNRQVFATTTIKNDHATLCAAYDAHRAAVASIRRTSVKGLVWTFFLQPLLPDWARKGYPNVLGLHEGTREPLVVASFTISWADKRDDDIVRTTLRRAVEQIDAVAAANGTGHRYRYLNYCAEWQRPLQGYGEESWRFMRGVSRKFDPDGLFQGGCAGGFKLDFGDDED